MNYSLKTLLATTVVALVTLFSTTTSYGQCTHSITITDSEGDGWTSYSAAAGGRLQRSQSLLVLLRLTIQAQDEGKKLAQICRDSAESEDINSRATSCVRCFWL